MSAWKVLQRQLYDVLSNKCYLILFFLLVYTSFISVLHFCEAWISGDWAPSKNFNTNIFVDNINEKSFHYKLCQYYPIDVVYTWVNGSDPLFEHQLKVFEMRLQKESALSCKFMDCVPSHFTAFRSNYSELPEVLDSLNYVSKKVVKSKSNENWTVVRWDSVKSAEEQAYKVYKVKEQSLFTFHVYWTTDESIPNIFFPSNAVAIKALNKSLDLVSQVVLDQLLGEVTFSVWRYPQVIYAELGNQADVDKLLKGKKWNIISIRKTIKLNVTKAGFILEFPSKYRPDDLASSRFEDKEELRYSLRSIEKFAPWVRKVFIVTNGQIPHWLDLSNPRIQVVTHESIFTNSSHLPTFSSPAIEAHIHRIPGLSQKFLYFNDDIFLGDEVLPEDFFTLRGGYKVYLSWPVPDCSTVCPWTWVGDGTCDVPCNISACDFDGGDCLSSQVVDVSPHHYFSLEDYQDDQQAFYPSLNQSLHSHLFEGYRKSISKSKSKNGKLVNGSLQDSGESSVKALLQFLMKNRTSLGVDLVQDMMLYLQQHHLNVSLTEKSGLKNQSNEIHSNNPKRSVLFSKIIESYKLETTSKRKSVHSPKNNGRNLLNIQNMNEVEQLMNSTIERGSITTRVISSINLSRGQVGLPPIEVAERFYATQSDIASLQRKLDTFAESLLYVNSLLNKRYGYKARKVPSHMPHLIDKDIMSGLQSVFPGEYNKTSSHYFRHPEDMQFSFSYFYYLMSEEVEVPLSNIFDTFDTDESGTWSDRELRTVLTRLHDLPLQRSSVLSFETALLFCAKDFHYKHQPSPPPYERYVDSKLPLITKDLVKNCTIVADLLKRKMGRKKRYLYTLVKASTRESTVGFHMITSNMSHVLTALDKIRSHPKKFICLNDNLDPFKEQDNQLIRAILVDFFHSLFPKASKFELPADYRNRYIYYSDYIIWQSSKKKLSFLMYTTLIVVVVLIFYCLFYTECQRWYHKAKRKMKMKFKSNILK